MPVQDVTQWFIIHGWFFIFYFLFYFLAEIQTKGEPSLNSKEYQNSD